jgi:acetyl esterase/lipase
MYYNQINIWDDFNVDVKGKSTLKIYIPDNSPEISMERRNKAVLICPGGGYEFVSDRESEPIALAFLAEGFNAFVLTYEVAPAIMHPQPLLDVSRAMCIIRENAEKWHTDAQKIAVCGFSAGGHLAASLGVFWAEQYIRDALHIPYGLNKPNALILCYPVITSLKDKAHRGSFYNLLGENQTEDVYARLSLEKHVSSKTPPSFIWHTFDDTCVPVENSLLFAQSLKENDISFELHIFPQGNHGLSLADERTGNSDNMINEHVAKWFDLCVEWLKHNAFEIHN